MILILFPERAIICEFDYAFYSIFIFDFYCFYFQFYFICRDVTSKASRKNAGVDSGVFDESFTEFGKPKDNNFFYLV